MGSVLVRFGNFLEGNSFFQVVELEEEAAALFDRVSAAEDKAGAAEARAHSLAHKLEAALASLQAIL